MLIKVIDKDSYTDYFITAKTVDIDFRHKIVYIYDINDNHYCFEATESEARSLSKWLWLNRSWSFRGKAVLLNVKNSCFVRQGFKL